MKRVKTIQNFESQQTPEKASGVLSNQNFEQITLEETVTEATIAEPRAKMQTAHPPAEKERKKQEKKEILLESDLTLQDKKEQLEEVEDAVKNQKSKKKKWTSFLGLLINLLVVGGLLTYQLLTEDGEVASFTDLVSTLIGAFLCW